MARVNLRVMVGLVLARAMVVGCLLTGATAVCAAQAYTPPPPPLTMLPPCPADKDAKKRAKRKDCDPTVYPSETKEVKGNKTPDAPAVAPPASGTAAEKFPFPGEKASADPAAAAKAADTPAGRTYPYPGESTPNVPYDPAAAKKATETPSGKSFPYPGSNAGSSAGATPSDTPSNTAAQPPRPDDSSSSTSSSSDDDVAGSKTPKSSAARNRDDDDDDDEVQPQPKPNSGRRVLQVTKPQSDTDRVDEDLSVARYYSQSGNSMGAYLRARDAVKTQPEYPEGHFALGEAAKKLNKKDEAVAEFEAYLKLAPDGQRAKAAEKALAELK